MRRSTLRTKADQGGPEISYHCGSGARCRLGMRTPQLCVLVRGPSGMVHRITCLSHRWIRVTTLVALVVFCACAARNSFAQDYVSVHQADPFDVFLLSHIRSILESVGVPYHELQPPGQELISFETDTGHAAEAVRALQADPYLADLEQSPGPEDERVGAGVDWTELQSSERRPAVKPDHLLLDVADDFAFRSAAGDRHTVLSFRVRNVRYFAHPGSLSNGMKCVVQVVDSAVSVSWPLNLVLEVDETGSLLPCFAVPAVPPQPGPGIPRWYPGFGVNIGRSGDIPVVNRMYRYSTELNWPTSFWSQALMDFMVVPPYVGTQCRISKTIDDLALVTAAADDPIVLRVKSGSDLHESALTQKQRLAAGLGAWALSGDSCWATSSLRLKGLALRLLTAYVTECGETPAPRANKLLSYVELAVAMCRDAPGGGHKVEALQEVAAKYRTLYPDRAFEALYALASYYQYRLGDLARAGEVAKGIQVDFPQFAGWYKFHLLKGRRYEW